MTSKRDIESLRLNKSDDLCELAEMLGYGNSRFNQLQCSNGAYVSSLLAFFDDNPGVMEAVRGFILDNLASYDVEDDGPGEEEEDEP